MFKKLDKEQRNKVAEKIMERANYTFIGLTVTHVFSNGVDAFVGIIATVVLVLAYIFSMSVMRGGKK